MDFIVLPVLGYTSIIIQELRGKINALCLDIFHYMREKKKIERKYCRMKELYIVSLIHSLEYPCIRFVW